MYCIYQINIKIYLQGDVQFQQLINKILTNAVAQSKLKAKI